MIELKSDISEDGFLIIAPADEWPDMPGTKVGLISDTHGKLAPDVFDALSGSDIILHAGDIVGDDILPSLEALAPVEAVLGNNDYVGQYGLKIGYINRLSIEDVSIKIVHKPQDIEVFDADIIMFGHTHVPHFELVHPNNNSNGTLLINPGSSSRSRSQYKHTVARMIIDGHTVQYFALVQLA